ncbi:MAG: hypothetical protein JSU01_18180 [Bacteroidetes bacterium]|nr:hypothetical protein [Bacteroidota bacterium]
MEHQHEEKEINLKALYYIIGLITGVVTGLVIDNGIGLTIGLGVTGLLFAALYQNVFVRGREER